MNGQSQVKRFDHRESAGADFFLGGSSLFIFLARRVLANSAALTDDLRLLPVLSE
jgi:hypothetical protein